jgi:hypothetical protein
MKTKEGSRLSVSTDLHFVAYVFREEETSEFGCVCLGCGMLCVRSPLASDGSRWMYTPRWMFITHSNDSIYEMHARMTRATCKRCTTMDGLLK